MIKIKTTDHQIDRMDEWVRDETGWLDLDKMTVPIRTAGFRGTGEITVEEIKRKAQSRIKMGINEGSFDFSPRINHDRTMNEFRFYVLWKYVEESPNPSPNDDLAESPPPNTED